MIQEKPKKGVFPLTLNKSVHQKRTMLQQGGKKVTWEPKPPLSNTGAQNTFGSGLNPYVDWISCTFKNVEPEKLITRILRLNLKDFVRLDKGKHGYQKAYRSGQIAVFYAGHNPDMGVHVEMTGKGCRQFEAAGKMDWKTFFSAALAAGAKFSRVDLALDDHVGYWKFDTIVRKLKRGEVVSKFKRAKRIEGIDLKTGWTDGETIYFGSDSSAVQIRMYDKRLEALSKGEMKPEDIPDVWNRTEIQTRDDRAQRVAGLIAEDAEPIGTVIKGILKHYLRFTVKGKDTNKARWKTAPFWERFLGDVEAVRLAVKPEEPTVERKLNWLYRQAAVSMAIIVEARKNGVGDICDMIEDGKSRMKPKDWALIVRYREENPLEATVVGWQ